MKFKKPNPGLEQHLDRALAPFDCVRRKMFGQPAYFVNSNMFAGVFGDELFIRLSEAGRREIFSSTDEAVLFEPMKGRAMKEYVVIPESLYNDKEDFERWLNLSFEYASSLPPKIKNKKRSK